MATFKIDGIEYKIIRNPKTNGPMIARVDGIAVDNRKEICRRFLRLHGWTNDMMTNDVITNVLERRVNDIVNSGIMPVETEKFDTNKRASEMTIEVNENPYVLDFATSGNIKIPALTRKNADFIEAVVGLDSNYSRDADIDAQPEKGFDVYKNVSSSGGKYCGSPAYWFHKMENGGNFEECLLGIIISIDRSNSTHLESAVNGRTKIKNIILNKCKNINDLRTELEKDFRLNAKEHILGLMSEEMEAKKKGTNRSNLSFASKFCSYASIFLKTKIEYSKYDNVVASHLSDYIKLYLNDNSTKKSKYKQDATNKKKSRDTLQYTIDIYSTYYKLIGDIIDSLHKQNIFINRNEFDHIVWYGFKGK